MYLFPDSKVHVANMGPTWVLLAPMLAPWTLLSGLLTVNADDLLTNEVIY